MSIKEASMFSLAVLKVKLCVFIWTPVSLLWSDFWSILVIYVNVISWFQKPKQPPTPVLRKVCQLQHADKNLDTVTCKHFIQVCFWRFFPSINFLNVCFIPRTRIWSSSTSAPSTGFSVCRYCHTSDSWCRCHLAYDAHASINCCEVALWKGPEKCSMCCEAVQQQ